MSRQYSFEKPSRRQSGLTLVELMIALAINLVVVLVAAYLYLNGRSTQQSVEERAALFENAQLALELIGREIGNAGFYPAHRNEPNAKGVVVSLGRYVNPVPGTAAFDAGVFGCVDKLLRKGQCTAHTSDTRGDGLVLNYFTDDAFSLQAGGRADCQGNDVVNDDVINNVVRTGGRTDNSGLPPAFPLFVSNRFSLHSTSSVENGKTVTEWGLACSSNVSASYQTLIPGIEQFRVRYGIREASAPRAVQYLDADGVNSAAPIVVGDQTLRAWQRVVSVEVCVVASSRTRTRFNGAGASTQADCSGNTLVSSDNVQRRRFVQVFGLKNQLTQSYSPGG